MKQFAKRVLAGILGWQVRRLRRKNVFRLVVVAGSIGKTSTKLAIASMLAHKYRVCYQNGNYNHLVTAPLVFFGQTEPSLFNIFGWLGVIIKNELLLHRSYPYDVVILELGTDGPGQLKEFGAYVSADLGVVSAIAPEHMENFKDLDAVAAEELSIQSFCQKLLANKDLCGRYLKGLSGVETYGRQKAGFTLSDAAFDQEYYDFTVTYNGQNILTARYEGVAETELYSVLAAVAVGHTMDLSLAELIDGIKSISPAAGRMRRLKGINGSIILDDSYNASPEATKAALRTLYSLEAPQRVAILGNMNELGEYSEQAHTEIGEYCDPDKLALVITLGTDANRYLAAAAAAKGCNVKTAGTPYEAADLIKAVIKPGAVILAKGSQNGVYAEEAVKQLLADPTDVDKLVRQSPDWLRKKAKSFELIRAEVKQ